MRSLGYLDARLQLLASGGGSMKKLYFFKTKKTVLMICSLLMAFLVFSLFVVIPSINYVVTARAEFKAYEEFKAWQDSRCVQTIFADKIAENHKRYSHHYSRNNASHEHL